jgi:hypothetical protein
MIVFECRSAFIIVDFALDFARIVVAEASSEQEDRIEITMEYMGWCTDLRK